ncbi:hypothetical protein ANCCEY_04160 [Ancylostoma ceylanicum]|uniref:CX domain-containing protein n=2 Tax=Ancylostoma ceylanicum TaxID=53326 RepID=A0A0D6LY04_9BILA|nr:hypothetical protein ANCCEY_04160 [Ancylostoma ceylanicum]EYB99626.1 hypothetical protein Y032_0121g965 [Ancylostoma ceylanicum]
MSRWESLPVSEQQQRYLASTTTTTTIDPLEITTRRALGGLIRQEISEAGQKICYYRSGSSNDFPIPYLCEMGCCNHGCCTVADLAARSNSFGWAIALLSIVLITIVLALIAIFAVYLMNRRKDQVLKRQIVYGGDSSAASQISGPTSYYPRDSYYNTQSLKHF